MLKRFTREVTKKEQNNLFKVIKATKRFLAFIGMIGLLLNYVPWKIIEAEIIDGEESIIKLVETHEDQSYFDSKNIDQSLVPVSNEVISERTENTKTFRKIDGTYEVALYEDTIHYLEDGTYKEINNSLIDTGSEYINKDNKFQVTFPKSLDNNNQINLSMDEYRIDWSVSNISRSDIRYDNNKISTTDMKEVANINQSIRYHDVQPHVDLEYIVTGSKVKENIILNQYVEDFSMSFTYDLTNLELSKDHEGNITFINENNEAIFSFEDLYMVDDEGNTSYDIEFTVEKTKSEDYNITVTPNNEWLAKASYPVVIDPTVNSSTTTMNIFDTYVSEANPNTNYASSTIMNLSNTSSSEYRGLLYFYIPSAVSDKVITYAKLDFTKYSVTNNAQINVYKNTQNFSSASATWNNMPSRSSRVVDYYTVDANTPFTYDITAPVKEWHEDGLSRTPGFTFILDEYYGSYNAVYQNGASSSYRPKITIGYEEPAGLKDYWTYTTQDMGLVGTGYISDYTGNLTWVRSEYVLDNEFLSMTLAFYHNTFNRTENIGYGDGWKTNYDLKVVEDGSKYYLHKPDGNKIYFMDEDCDLVYTAVYECTAIAEDGSRMVLDWVEETGQEGSFSITTTSDLKYTFNNDMLLSNIRNTKTSHDISVNYVSSNITGVDYVIDYVEDEADNRIEFTYNAGNLRLEMTELKLEQTDSSLRTVEQHEYSYDGYNNIDYIEQGYKYGTDIFTTMRYDNELHYYFDANNRFINAYNENDNFKIIYDYDGSNRIDDIQTEDGASKFGHTTVSYDTNQTTYTDYEGDTISYTFDNYGHTINIIDSFGNSMFYRYATLFTNLSGNQSYDNYFDYANVTPNYYINHALLESSDIIKQQQNPINNHGFEEGSGTHGWTAYGNATFSTSEAMLGEKSARLYRTTSTTYLSQSIYLDDGDYTIQGWIKHLSGSPGSYIDIIGEDSQGTMTKIYSSDGWEKYEITFTLNTAKTITIKLVNDTNTSVAYFDNIQLIEGFSDTRYNPILNNSFESGTSSWTTSGFYSITNSETGIMKDILGEKAIYTLGDGGTTKAFSQSVINLVEEGETYVVGGWGKANTVPNKTFYNQTNDRFFGIIVDLDIEPEDETPDYSIQYYLPFNASYTDWQYQMVTFTVPYDTVEVSIVGQFEGEGLAYFDNFQLYHDTLYTKYNYSSTNGNMESVVSSDGNETSYEYDCNFNISQVESNDIETDINRTSTCQVEEVIRNNVRTTIVYDSTTKQVTDTYVGYDKDLTLQQQDMWFKTSTTYTTDNQYINTVTDEFGNTTTTTIDYTVGLITEILDEIGNSQDFVYDEYGNLKSVTVNEDGTSNTMSTSYSYDSSQRLWKIHRDGYYYEFHYNDLDQVDWVKIANVEVMDYEYWEETEGTTTYSTDLLKKQTYGNNDYVEFTYNEENQVETIKFNGTTRFEYTYDSSGRQSVFKDIHNSNIYFYSYDLAGKLEKITDKDGNTIEYTYDELGNVNGYEYNIGSVSREILYYYNQTTGEYDYTEYTVGTTTITNEYNYDADSLRRLDNIELSIGSIDFTKTFTYDDSKVDSTMGNATNRVFKITYDNDGTIVHYEYTYDENHNITQIKVLDNASPTRNIIDQYDYHYDGFNQLVREDVTINSGSFSKTYVYEYDDWGNITVIEEHTYTTTSTVTTNPLAKKELYFENSWKDQVTTIEIYSGTTLVEQLEIDYDATGNPIMQTDDVSGATIEYTWDGRQMTGYYTEEDYTSYKYNDQGIRVEKGDHKYVVDGDKVLVETRGSTITIYYTYDVDGTLLSMNYNGSEYFYIKNLQGDIIELVDTSGTTVAKYKYDAWGNTIYSTGSMKDINPYRYRGYRYDDDTGLYYLQSRYYNPQIGRFISGDGIFGVNGNTLGHNMYAYTLNNPVMGIDRLGQIELITLLIIVIISAAVISGGAYLYNNISTKSQRPVTATSKEELLEKIDERAETDAHNIGKLPDKFNTIDELSKISSIEAPPLTLSDYLLRLGPAQLVDKSYQAYLQGVTNNTINEHGKTTIDWSLSDIYLACVDVDAENCGGDGLYATYYYQQLLYYRSREED